MRNILVLIITFTQNVGDNMWVNRPVLHRGADPTPEGVKWRFSTRLDSDNEAQTRHTDAGGIKEN